MRGHRRDKHGGILPRRVIVYQDDVPAQVIVWTLDEWCKQLPSIWVRIAGCSRCIDDVDWQRLRRIFEEEYGEDGRWMVYHLWAYGFAEIPGSGQRWWLRYHRGEERVCITPWPRMLYATTLSEIDKK